MPEDLKLEQKRPNLVHEAEQALLRRWAKYSDPLNEEWDFDDAEKWERHAINAVLDIQVLRAELAQVRAERWIPVGEKLPERSKRVFVYDATWGAVYVSMYDDAEAGEPAGWYQNPDRETNGIITHWMALPAPPEKEES